MSESSPGEATSEGPAAETASEADPGGAVTGASTGETASEGDPGGAVTGASPGETAGEGNPGGVLLLKNLVVARGGRDVVRDVTLEIPPGEVTALLGPNGAGKSSMVLAVGGVLALKGGSVLLDNLDLTRRRPERIRRAGLAIVPEGRRLLPELTVDDNIRVATYSLSASEAQAGRKRALEMFPELQKRLSALARSLSGGEQQMVVLAQALVSQPKFVIIDELSLGLAPVVVQRLIPTIRAVADSGIGVLLIEQFATLALGMSNRAYVMEGGRVQYAGTAQELREKPDLLHSAYLLRGRGNGAPAVNESLPAGG